MAQPFHDPLGFKVHKNSRIIRTGSGGQNAHNPTFQWVTASEIKNVLGIGHQSVSHPQPQRFSKCRTQDTLPQLGKWMPRGKGELAKVEIVDRRPNDGVRPCSKRVAQGDGQNAFALADLVPVTHTQTIGEGIAKIKRVKHQVIVVSFDAKQQWGLLGSGTKTSFKHFCQMMNAEG